MIPDPLPRDRRRALEQALRRAHPWLADPGRGPAHVDAGECDRCGAEPRLVETCGPVGWRRLGRRCAAEVGVEAWCDGHLDEATQALAWLDGLPDEADDAARLWWVATGEVRLTSLAELVRRALPADGAGGDEDQLSDFR